MAKGYSQKKKLPGTWDFRETLHKKFLHNPKDCTQSDPKASNFQLLESFSGISHGIYHAGVWWSAR